MAILPVGKLVSILRESNDAEIMLNTDDEGTLIKTTSGRFTMPSGDPTEFPDIPAFDDSGKHHEITAGVLRTMIKRTAFAAEKREKEVAREWEQRETAKLKELEVTSHSFTRPTIAEELIATAWYSDGGTLAVTIHPVWMS